MKPVYVEVCPYCNRGHKLSTRKMCADCEVEIEFKKRPAKSRRPCFSADDLIEMCGLEVEGG